MRAGIVTCTQSVGCGLQCLDCNIRLLGSLITSLFAAIFVSCFGEMCYSVCDASMVLQQESGSSRCRPIHHPAMLLLSIPTPVIEGLWVHCRFIRDMLRGGQLAPMQAPWSPRDTNTQSTAEQGEDGGLTRTRGHSRTRVRPCDCSRAIIGSHARSHLCSSGPHGGFVQWSRRASAAAASVLMSALVSTVLHL